MYLPETLEPELPAFERFGVRMVVEAKMRLDHEDTSDIALRALAVGESDDDLLSTVLIGPRPFVGPSSYANKGLTAVEQLRDRMQIAVAGP